MALSALIVLAALLVLTAAGGCLRLAALRRRVQVAGSELNGQLHRRRDRIPFWIETLRRCDGSPPEMLEGVTQAREQAAAATGIPARAEAENQLTQALHSLFAAAADPGRQASPDLRRLQEELTEIENQLFAAGWRYNDLVMALNVTISRFPWRLVARPAGFRPIEYFVLDEPPRPEAPRQG